MKKEFSLIKDFISNIESAKLNGEKQAVLFVSDDFYACGDNTSCDNSKNKVCTNIKECNLSKNTVCNNSGSCTDADNNWDSNATNCIKNTSCTENTSCNNGKGLLGFPGFDLY